MKKLPLVWFAFLFFVVAARADEQLQQVQQLLKDQGFYYGIVDGEDGTETSAAIRRYQIRNSLEVIGKLNSETLASLKLGKAPEVASDENTAPPPAATPPPNIVENDKNFLRRQTPPASAVEPEPETPEPAETPPPVFSNIFQHTPYERAPLVVQRDTIRRAQARLARDGFYRGPADGDPGSGTQRAIAGYQRDAGLPVTGRLDLDTLSDMHLLPGARTFIPDAPPRARDDFDEPPRRVYRGIWIH